MTESSGIIRSRLLAMKNEQFKKFHCKLMPTIDPESVIGVKIPLVRKLAKDIIKEYNSEQLISFMKDLPHKYYEENNLHAFLIEQIDDYDKCLYALDDFLPYVDNWATCDSLNPKSFKENKDVLIKKIKEWLKSERPYTVRFAAECLMKYYLDDNFENEYLELICNVKSDEYYVNMMRAWFFATAIVKQYESAIPYIKNKKLDIWTHNKIIQKAIESNRISKKEKEELKKYKIYTRIEKGVKNLK